MRCVWLIVKAWSFWTTLCWLACLVEWMFFLDVALSCNMKDEGPKVTSWMIVGCSWWWCWWDDSAHMQNLWSAEILIPSIFWQITKVSTILITLMSPKQKIGNNARVRVRVRVSHHKHGSTNTPQRKYRFATLWFDQRKKIKQSAN